ncbi:PREDICTED: uncharacterized protein LOC108376340 [Rhagoletis zephyria]|uniref:uncharacterized protein LOC108376340 n=1 Tax=Rhagoletis zephyria TaxID=28612 RepID=UPI0008116C88|nr:PREDICTED: uncharacterized protein LOC108376340 [Rhagoletis zephyria]
MPDNSSKFNPDAQLDIPKWINVKYFEKILHKEDENFQKILKLAVIPATPPGENYTSLMMRILMDIELKDGYTQQKAYIVKTTLDDDKGGTLINALNLFPKEKLMYERILPELEQLYHDLDKKVKFAANCQWIEQKSSRTTIVLEDLNTKKFRNINRLQGFDMLHMKRVLEKLAEFHAATVMWHEKHGAFPVEFQKTYLPANYQKSKSYQARVQSFKAAMATWGLDDYDKYVERIPNAEQFVNAAMSCFRSDPSEFKVLNHGDFWSSNIMLNYTSSGEVNQIRFVDFQLCRWGSPAQDLWELIVCSVVSNLRIWEFDHFVRIYHTHLLKCLKLLNYEKAVPKLSELHISMLKHGFWGYSTTFTHLVLILLPSDKDASLLKLIQPGEEGDRFRHKAYTNPLYVRAMLDILPFLYRRGILDFHPTSNDSATHRRPATYRKGVQFNQIYFRFYSAVAMGTGAKNYQPPEWITAEFLQDVLKEYFKDDTLEVREIVVKSALGGANVGSGYASEMHRATFNLARKDGTGRFSVIIKDHPKGYTGVVAHKSKLFKREIVAYKEILPRVEELLASIGDKTKIAPACYYTTETPEPFLVLEDMQLTGFENFEKGRLLNLDYTLPAIERLAKLHACSAVIAKETPEVLEIFHEAPISRNPDRKDFLGFFPVNIRCVAEELTHWKGYEEITEKMFKLAETVLQNALQMYESHDQGFRVFNSADLWIDNLMFHINNDTKEPDEVVLLDFQLSYYGSPAVDLNYFLFGSLNENVRKVHFKYIVREYHRILKETLEKLHYDGEIPTLKDINIELIKNSLQGVIAATCLTPLILMESTGDEKLENLTTRTEEGDQMRRQNVENPKYRAFLQRTVKEFELCGFLDA